MTDVVNLYGFDITVEYDSALLHGISVAVGPFFSGPDALPIIRRISDAEGKVQVAVTLTGNQTGLTGDGILFQALFEVTNVGSAPFDVVEGQLALVDSSIPPQPIVPEQVIDGVFDNRAPDVAVTSVTVVPTSVLQGQSVAIAVVVENHGSVTESFDVAVSYDSTLIDSETVANLPPDRSHQVSYSWTTFQVPPGVYHIQAVADVVPGETNTADNTGISESVTVRIENAAPVISQLEDQNVDEGSRITFTVVANDPDSADMITLSASPSLPPGASFPTSSGNPATSVFAWTPSESQGPGDYEIIFTATDGFVSVTAKAAIHVNEINQPPSLGSVPDKTVDTGTLLTFTVNASDPDGNSLVFSLTKAPSGTFPEGASISASGVFSWTPSSSQGPGTYSVRIVVSDGLALTAEDVSITVAGPSRVAFPGFTDWLPWVALGLVIIAVVLVVVVRARRRVPR